MDGSTANYSLSNASTFWKLRANRVNPLAAANRRPCGPGRLPRFPLLGFEPYAEVRSVGLVDNHVGKTRGRISDGKGEPRVGCQAASARAAVNFRPSKLRICPANTNTPRTIATNMTAPRPIATRSSYNSATAPPSSPPRGIRLKVMP